MPNISSYSKSTNASGRRRVNNGILDYANNSEIISLVGANNEIILNSTTKEINIHDAQTAGGARFAVATPTANTSTRYKTNRK